MSIPTAIGHLHMLWWWCFDYAQDGDLTKFEASDIADATMWEGDADEFVDALIYAEFLDQSDDELVVHDWFDYAGRLIERREKNADRMRKTRAGTKKERATHVQRTNSARAGLPNTTQPNQTELKDEEEYAHTREDHSASDPQDAFDIPDAPVEEAPSALGAMWRACEEIFPLRFNSIQIAKIEAHVTDDGMEPALIVETLRDARLLGKGLDYALGILRNKYAEGIRTLDEYKMSQEIFQAQKAAKTNETRAAPRTRQEQTMNAIAAVARRIQEGSA